jgi:hypothetical protein
MPSQRILWSYLDYSLAWASKVMIPNSLYKYILYVIMLIQLNIFQVFIDQRGLPLWFINLSQFSFIASILTYYPETSSRPEISN